MTLFAIVIEKGILQNGGNVFLYADGDVGEHVAWVTVTISLSPCFFYFYGKDWPNFFQKLMNSYTPKMTICVPKVIPIKKPFPSSILSSVSQR